MDAQFKDLSDIDDNAGHEMIRWYAVQSEKQSEKLLNRTELSDQEGDGTGSNGTWPNLAELIDGISLEEYAGATMEIVPPGSPGNQRGTEIGSLHHSCMIPSGRRALCHSGRTYALVDGVR